MTTDFRALCAELSDALRNAIRVVYHEDGTQHISTAMPILRRARAALADGPAVPEGREPASVTGQPSDKRPTVMEIIELSSEIEAAGLGQVDFARAVLARWGKPTPVPPADEELTRLWFETDGRAVLGAKEYARAVLARWGNPAPVPPADVSQLSDGYHTFAELYEHRYSLMLALMRALPRICWFSRRHADGELPFGSDDWFIVGAELPGAPITYHLPAALYSLAQKTGALELPAGRPWDGHSAADVVHRLRDWAIAPTPPADGEVAELMEGLRLISDGMSAIGHDSDSWFVARAAELLERLASPACVVLKPSPELIEAFKDALPGRIEPLLEECHPTPVPVAERLPGPEDYAPWPQLSDNSGWCWMSRTIHGFYGSFAIWEQVSVVPTCREVYTHWLPAHALPVPEVK